VELSGTAVVFAAQWKCKCQTIKRRWYILWLIILSLALFVPFSDLQTEQDADAQKSAHSTVAKIFQNRTSLRASPHKVSAVVAPTVERFYVHLYTIASYTKLDSITARHGTCLAACRHAGCRLGATFLIISSRRMKFTTCFSDIAYNKLLREKFGQDSRAATEMCCMHSLYTLHPSLSVCLPACLFVCHFICTTW